MIVPVFIMNKGCPNRCIFCNIQKIAGDAPSQISESQLRRIVVSYVKSAKKKPDSVQIAFYGGNVTGLDRNEEEILLNSGKTLIDEGIADTIRISTRPDYIDEEQCALLKSYEVATVEIGAQSMVDEVLQSSERGHSAADTERAVSLLKKHDFETGIHLMCGLPGDDEQKFKYTIDRSIRMRPHTVRLHPTIVFEKTRLAEEYKEGRYQAMTLPQAVDACKYAARRLASAGIPVIRMGLQPTYDMESAGSIVAGPFHPAFHALIEESFFFDKAAELLSNATGDDVAFTVSPRDISYMRGQKNSNIQKLKNKFHLKSIAVKADPAMTRGTIVIG